MRSLLTPNLLTPYLVDEKLAHVEIGCEFRSADRTLQVSNRAGGLHAQFDVGAASPVLGWRDRFEMIGSYARRLTAEMVKVETIRDRANLLYVHRAVSVDLFSCDTNHVVATACSARPNVVLEYEARRLIAAFLKTVVILSQSGPQCARRVSRSINGGFAASALAKLYTRHLVASLREVTLTGRRASYPPTPFYLAVTTTP
jgi:hypothetical protein